MKIKRYKKAQRYLTFYKNHFGFRPPYHVLIDATFCQAALKNKVNLGEQIPKYLCEKVKLCTTVCVVTETDKLGPALYGAALIVKQYPVQKCGHEKKPISASECLYSMVKDKNPDHYILATQDSSLSDKVRKLPGCPLLYLKVNCINFERPSAISESQAKSIAAIVDNPLDHEMETLKQLKKAELGEPEEKKKKRKGPKGPNPLSVKKKKSTSTVTDNKDKKGDKNENKRSRKKNKLKLPKQMSKLIE